MTTNDPIPKDWCLVRWKDGRDARALIERALAEVASPVTVQEGERAAFDYDTVSRCSFCGPLSMLDEQVDFAAMRASRGIVGFTGFPNGGVGDIVRFASAEEALAFREHHGQHITVDIPTLVSRLSFRVETYDCWDGKKHTLVCRDFDEAWLHFRARSFDATRRKTLKVTLASEPIWKELGDQRPGTEESDAINTRAERLRAEWELRNRENALA